MSADDPKLLMCPFCGCAKVTLHPGIHEIGAWVSCYDCGLETPTETGVTVEQAAEYWNTRAALSPAGGEEGDLLPCDVHLPVNTYIRKGVPISTLMTAITARENFPLDATQFPAHPVDAGEPVAWREELADEMVILAANAMIAVNSLNQGLRFTELMRAMAHAALTEVGKLPVPSPDSKGREEWRPIETAPKDGTRMLGTGGGLESTVELISYNERVGAWDTENYTLDDRDDEAEGYNRPTHWQPLPAALAQAKP